METGTGTSILLPIELSLTMHGVSGIKRGDKFRVGGIPKAYEETGFFQVTSVKQTITDMIWKTEIEGGFSAIAKTTVPKTDFVCQSKVLK